RYPLLGFSQIPAQPPDPAEARAQPHGRLQFEMTDRPFQSASEVVMLPLESIEPNDLLWPMHFWLGPLGEGDVEVEVPRPCRRLFAGFSQPVPAVLADRLQQTVARLSRRLLHLDQRPVDEAREQLQDLVSLDAVFRAHLLSRVEGEAADEDREPPQQGPFVLPQQVVAP